MTNPVERLRGEIRGCLWAAVTLSGVEQQAIARRMGRAPASVSNSIRRGCSLETAALIAAACGYRLVVQVEAIE